MVDKHISSPISSSSERAMSWLLKFFCVLLSFLGKFSQKVASIAVALPSSIYLRDKYLGLDGMESFTKYVVCPKC